LNRTKRKPREDVLEKIYVYALPEWISIYEVSKEIYGYDDDHVNRVVKKISLILSLMKEDRFVRNQNY
jgi:hypothetical protein